MHKRSFRTKNTPLGARLDADKLTQLKQRFGIVGQCPKMHQAIQVAAQAAATAMTILITGESGTGKESFSKIVHALSPYKHGSFVAINCGAIPEGTIDSELFGHKKGSFTGASEDRKGYFEEADGGTLFLDEVGELPLGTQARLLRVLEYGEFIKVGCSKVTHADVRLVAATNVDLLTAVREGKFREDLYYRLCVVPIRVPPLRERGKDVLLLFSKFASDFADRYYVDPLKLTEVSEKLLMTHPLPGNIRQLKHLVEQMSVLERDRLVVSERLSQYLPEASPTLPTLSSPSGTSAPHSWPERELLYKVLFDLRQDVVELKRLIFERLRADVHGNRLIKEHAMLFSEAMEMTSEEGQDPLPSPNPALNAQENLSIEEKEHELIVKALERYPDSRKSAAQSLGISERTLYRKIKEHDLG